MCAEDSACYDPIVNGAGKQMTPGEVQSCQLPQQLKIPPAALSFLCQRTAFSKQRGDRGLISFPLTTTVQLPDLPRLRWKAWEGSSKILSYLTIGLV